MKFKALGLLVETVLIGNLLADLIHDSVDFSTKRSARNSLISFKPFGKDVAIGLDFELPFVSVPLTRHADEFGAETAMVNINTASLVTSALLAGGGLAVAQLFRVLGLQTIKPKKDAGNHSKERRSDVVDELDKLQFLDNFKLMYRNSSGEKFETTLPGLFAKVEETFLDNDINLAACLQKSICSLVANSSENVRSGKATGLQKILDGFLGLKWFMKTLRANAVLRDAIDAGGKANGLENCKARYVGCKWNMPEKKLLHLLKTYVKFL